MDDQALFIDADFVFLSEIESGAAQPQAGETEVGDAVCAVLAVAAADGAVADDDGFGLSQFVPQLTYDIIARFIPGILLLGLVSFIWSDELKEFLPWTANGGLWECSRLPGVILISYFLSQIFETIWYLWIDKYVQKRFDEAKKDVARKALGGIKDADPGFPCERYAFPDLSLIYDAIRLKNPVAGARIVKIRAEVQLFRTD